MLAAGLLLSACDGDGNGGSNVALARGKPE